MRIVFPLLNLSMSGGMRVTLQHAAGLARRGHDVTLLVVAGAVPDYLELPSELGVRFVPIPSVARHSLGYLAVVVALGKAIPPCDVILANSWKTVYPALIGKRRHRGVRVTFLIQGLHPVVEGTLSGRPRPIRMRNKIMSEYVYGLPIQKVVVSSWLQSVLAEKYGQSSVCVPNGVDVAAFPDVEGKSWTPPIETYDVLCLGRAAKSKGFQDIVEAVRELAANDPRVRLIVAARERLKIPTDFPTVLVRSESDAEVGALYRTCSVFAFPSWLEGFGLPPLEAMACGAPVVTTDCGGIRDFARHGENCLIVPARQPRHLCSAIRHLKQDEGLARRLANEGMITAQAFTMEEASEKLEVVLRA